MDEKENFKKIFRWFAVIPGSFLAGFLATFPLHWVLYVTLSNKEFFVNGLGLLEPIEYFLSPIVTMIVFILVGFKIAPKYKFQTSVFLAILWVVFIIFISLTNFSNFETRIETRTIFTFIGILITLYINWRKNKEIIINKE